MLERITFYIKKKLVAKGFLVVKKNPGAIKWGIIGLGNMAEVISTTIDGNKDAIVHGVASRSIEKATSFAARHGKCKAYGRYDEMLKDPNNNLDIIYIATPVMQHYAIVKQCLLAGKNVLCEKPITYSSSQFKELVELAKENNCFLMEGMWMKCLPTFRQAHKWINEGQIGKIELVKADFYKKELIKPELSIFDVNEGGGVLTDYGVYAISFMTTFLKGVPESMQFSERVSSFGIDSDWQISAQKEKKRAFINISSNFSSQSKAAIIGEKGFIEWSSQFNRTNKITLFDSYGNQIKEFIYKYKYQGFEYEVEEVTRCLKSEKKESALVPLKESLDTLTVIDQLKINQLNNNL
jgi:predicted dehydrogenase